MDDPYMCEWNYGYDENGNLVYQKDGNGDITDMFYDSLNRLEDKIYQTDGTQVYYTYDEERTGYYNVGALTTVVFDDTETVYNYNEMGLTINESRTIAGTTYEIDRWFDLAGRLEYILYPENNGVLTIDKSAV